MLGLSEPRGKGAIPPYFDKSVNPISTGGGADYANNINNNPPSFSDPPKALLCTLASHTPAGFLFFV